MIIVKMIENEQLKQTIASTVIYNLPEWFGIPESAKEYINTVSKYPFFAAYENNSPIGFYSVRHENKLVLDMYVLGVLKNNHRSGAGTLLQRSVETYAKSKGYEYLMVLTLAEKVQNTEYLQTRAFYLKQGFIDFYQNNDIFDINNPCQIMIKKI